MLNVTVQIVELRMNPASIRIDLPAVDLHRLAGVLVRFLDGAFVDLPD